jgi:aspartate kinase
VAYDEMLEMASLGAKVLHSRSVEIAKKYGITIYCASTFSNEEGSYVMEENIEQPLVSGLSIMDNQTQVIISNLPVDYTIVNKIFQSAADENLNIDMISVIGNNNSLNVSFTIIDDKKEHVDEALSHLLKDFDQYNLHYVSGFSKISVVGVGMRSSSGVASKFFKALENIPIKLVTTSEIKISALVEEKDKLDAVKALTGIFEL